jgi:hypothetical protein
MKKKNINVTKRKRLPKEKQKQKQKQSQNIKINISQPKDQKQQSSYIPMMPSFNSPPPTQQSNVSDIAKIIGFLTPSAKQESLLGESVPEAEPLLPIKEKIIPLNNKDQTDSLLGDSIDNATKNKKDDIISFNPADEMIAEQIRAVEQQNKIEKIPKEQQIRADEMIAEQLNKIEKIPKKQTQITKDLERKSLKELREIATFGGIKNKKMNKSQLIEAINNKRSNVIDV